MIEWLMTGFIIIAAGIFAYMSAHINEEIKRGKKIPLLWEKKDKVKNHIDNLPEKREEGFPFNKPPLTGKGQFDKQRTTYTEGDNT